MVMESILKEIDYNLLSKMVDLGEKYDVDQIIIYKMNFGDNNNPEGAVPYARWPKNTSAGHEEAITIEQFQELVQKIENNIPIKGDLEEYKNIKLLSAFKESFHNFVILSLSHRSELWGFMLFLMKSAKIRWMGDDLLTLMEHASRIAGILKNEDMIASLVKVKSDYQILRSKGIDIYFRLGSDLTIKEMDGREVGGNESIKKYIGKTILDIAVLEDEAGQLKLAEECSRVLAEHRSFKRNLLLEGNDLTWYSCQFYPVQDGEIACVAINIDDNLRSLNETRVWLEALKQAFGSMKNIVVIMGEEGTLYVSPNTFDITGITDEKIRERFPGDGTGIFDAGTTDALRGVIERYCEGSDVGGNIRGEIFLGANAYGDAEIRPRILRGGASDEKGLLMFEIEEFFIPREIERIESLIERKHGAWPGQDTYIYALGINGDIVWADENAGNMFELNAGKERQGIDAYLEIGHQEQLVKILLSPYALKRRSEIVIHRLISGKRAVDVITVSFLAYRQGVPDRVICVSKKMVMDQSTLGHDQEMLIENISSEIRWIMDLELCFTYISPSVEHILGYSRDEAMREGLGKALSEKSDEELGRHLSAGLGAAKKNKPWSKVVSVEYSTASGEKLKGKMTINLAYRNDKPVSFVGVAEFARKQAGKIPGRTKR